MSFFPRLKEEDVATAAASPVGMCFYYAMGNFMWRKRFFNDNRGNGWELSRFVQSGNHSSGRRVYLSDPEEGHDGGYSCNLWENNVLTVYSPDWLSGPDYRNKTLF